MKLAIVAATCVAASAISCTTASASALHGRPQMVVETFRLHAVGKPPVGTTFWVAYGPLGGHFGLIQLHGTSGGMFEATQDLPARGRTIFAFLAGHGAMQTRAGRVPGDPVATIRCFGPAAIWQMRMPVVQWQGPTG